MNSQLELLSKVSLMDSISTEEKKSLLKTGSFRITEYGRNEIVHFAGDKCIKLEIILLGKVVLARIDESGNLMNVAEFVTGNLIGGNLIFSMYPDYPMTVTSIKPTVIMEVEKDTLLQLFSSNHEFLKKYLEYISDHTSILGDKIRYYVNTTIRESIISYLKYEKKQQNSNIIKLDITKKALAERLGVQRTSLSRELAKMRDENLLEFDKYTITLKPKLLLTLI